MKRKTYSYLLSATLALCTMMIFTNDLHSQAITPSATPTIMDRPGDCTADTMIDFTMLSADGKYLLAQWQLGEAAKLWDVQTGNALHTFINNPRSEMMSVAFSPDNEYVLTGSSDGNAILWNLSTGAQVHKLVAKFTSDSKFSSWVMNALFSPDGKFILTGNSRGGYLWDTKTGVKLHTFPGFMEQSDSLRFSPDGKRVLMDSTLGTVTLWDVQTGGKLHSFDNWRGIFSPDNQYILTFVHEHFSLWDAQKFTLIRSFDGDELLYFGFQGLVFSPDSKYLATYNSKEGVILWDVQTGVKVHSLKSASREIAVFSPNSEVLITSWNTELGVWNAKTGQEVRRFNIDSNLASVPRITPDSKYVVVADQNDKLQLWDLQTGKIVRRFC